MARRKKRSRGILASLKRLDKKLAKIAKGIKGGVRVRGWNNPCNK